MRGAINGPRLAKTIDFVKTKSAESIPPDCGQRQQRIPKIAIIVLQRSRFDALDGQQASGQTTRLIRTAADSGVLIDPPILPRATRLSGD